MARFLGCKECIDTAIINEQTLHSINFSVFCWGKFNGGFKAKNVRIIHYLELKILLRI
ncbi:hypothetical protein K0M31_013343 [Melipona bicolor]|uniref:Uncharacterized protein n=1 Tax=Melipona bicolor TaxID=60889 RepID=A0AA40FJ76_9HYME|nr:hypothetical protein K0M31_013343 [Melipona bicolor]